MGPRVWRDVCAASTVRPRVKRLTIHEAAAMGLALRDQNSGFEESRNDHGRDSVLLAMQGLGFCQIADWLGLHITMVEPWVGCLDVRGFGGLREREGFDRHRRSILRSALDVGAGGWSGAHACRLRENPGSGAYS